MNVAQTVAQAGETVEEKTARTSGYTEHLSTASPNRTVFELQIRWCILTLQNSRLRSNERQCVLDLMGQILLTFLGRETRGAGQ